MPLPSFSDDAQSVAGGPPSLFSRVSRPHGATAVALAAATALKRCGWTPTASTTTATAALSPAAASHPWPGRPGSMEWVFAFECPGCSNPFELHVSLQEVTLRMLLQLREMVPSSGGSAAAAAAAAAAASPPPPALALGASSICGISVGNYRRLPGEKGEDEVDDTTVDAEVVDAGDGDVDDSWRSLLKNTGPLEAMVSGLLAAPAAVNAARGPSPGERRRAKETKMAIAGALGAVVLAVVGAVAKKSSSEVEGAKVKQKEKQGGRKK